MTSPKKITVIPATKSLVTGTQINSRKKRRVAGYARVSTDSDEQFTSYEAQIDYYTTFIKKNPDWEFVEVYTDEGISGTSTRNRDGFNRMIADSLDGKIDLIVTKSISRFARNTVDTLTTVRKLKDAGVEVFFEKENIYTLDSKGELLITIMSSIAQEESRSISENVTWGHRKRFADGRVSMTYSKFLGYRKGADGTPEIVPEEAEIVRRIYREYMLGGTYESIVKGLTADGIPSPGGKSKWQGHAIKSILTNEKYKGAALLQKRVTTDFLTKKVKINEGEAPQYYVENSHPAIIDPEEWDMVQLELTRRARNGKSRQTRNPLFGMIFCEDCGAQYGIKVWHSTDKYRHKVLQCVDKYDHENVCSTPTIPVELFHEMFVEALSQYFKNRHEVLETLRKIQQKLADTREIDEKITAAESDMTTLTSSMRKLVRQNATAKIYDNQ